MAALEPETEAIFPPSLLSSQIQSNLAFGRTFRIYLEPLHPSVSRPPLDFKAPCVLHELPQWPPNGLLAPSLAPHKFFYHTAALEIILRAKSCHFSASNLPMTPHSSPFCGLNDLSPPPPGPVSVLETLDVLVLGSSRFLS